MPPTLDPRIDAYIAKAPEFARPILTHVRELVHEGCPDVEETMKWSSPAWMHHGIMCGMAAFKEHCTFGFWKHELVTGEKARGDAAGSFGRLTSVKDLPSRRTMLGYVRKAARLNEEGVRPPARRKAPKPELPVPPALAAALKKNRKAQAAFDAFPPSHRREYIEWIADAKGEDTRARRVAQAIEWMAEGKSRNWKYMK